MEDSPCESIKNNAIGTYKTAYAAMLYGCERFVLISTDKAVNPINLYGGTKLVSDKLFCAANAYGGEDGTRFSVVRYGNVAGSRGSVIPFFQNLIDKGEKELPITDFRMTRFWISLEQGVELVIKALEESKGGETFISKIPSFKITDLAEAMLPGCEKKEVGIREGEKLHEIMVTREDSLHTYEYEKHFIIYPHYNWWRDRDMIPGGKLVDQEFEYSSGTNTEWLSVEDLRAKLKTDLDEH
jgi:FlaA1/EpsC-like NDP-sugar epimerase